MVRLKVEGIVKLNNITKFQFQYGTIKRITVEQFAKYLINFNSNMVRLKEIVKLYIRRYN